MRDSIAELIGIRQRHCVFQPTDFAYHTEVLSRHGENLQRVDLTWMNGTTGEMSQDDWHDGARRLLGMYVSNDHEGFITWFNSSPSACDVVLPGLPWGFGYDVMWHSGEDGELPDERLEPGARFTLPGRTVALMRVQVPRGAAELLQRQAELSDLSETEQPLV